MGIKQKVFEVLKKQGYISDQQAAKIWDKEPNFSSLERYKREFFSIQNERNCFDDRAVYDKKKATIKGKSRYLLQFLPDKGTNKYYQVTKGYFMEREEWKNNG